MEPASVVDDASRRLPRIGEPAPPFEAVTSHGNLKLVDFKGGWLILFSYPADFTPVSTSELIAFAEIAPRLKQLHCELLGLSFDSVYSHIAWLRNIEEKLGARIGFPIIADTDRIVAERYGMIMPGESRSLTARCVFVIDDQQTVRAMLYYPMHAGRSTDEVLRLVAALQAGDEHGVATPADWRPGDDVLLLAPRTQGAAEDRVESGEPGCKDWYFCSKSS